MLLIPLADGSLGSRSLKLLRQFLTGSPHLLSENQLLETYEKMVQPALPILPCPVASLPPSIMGIVLTSSLSHSSTTRSIAAAAATLLDAEDMDFGLNSLHTVVRSILRLGLRTDVDSGKTYILLAQVRNRTREQD